MNEYTISARVRVYTDMKIMAENHQQALEEFYKHFSDQYQAIDIEALHINEKKGK
jgi:hypothetical protein